MMIEGLSVWDCLRHGKAAFGRSIVAQLIELVRLRMAHQKLGIEEYFLFNLNDSRALSFEEKTRFVGWRKLREIESRCIPKDWWAVVEDKLVLYSLLHALDLPIPRISGLYHPFRVTPFFFFHETGDGSSRRALQGLISALEPRPKGLPAVPTPTNLLNADWRKVYTRSTLNGRPSIVLRWHEHWSSWAIC